jgi:hypothetical protein
MDEGEDGEESGAAARSPPRRKRTSRRRARTADSSDDDSDEEYKESQQQSEEDEQQEEQEEEEEEEAGSSSAASSAGPGRRYSTRRALGTVPAKVSAETSSAMQRLLEDRRRAAAAAEAQAVATETGTNSRRKRLFTQMGDGSAAAASSSAGAGSSAAAAAVPTESLELVDAVRKDKYARAEAAIHRAADDVDDEDTGNDQYFDRIKHVSSLSPSICPSVLSAVTVSAFALTSGLCLLLCCVNLTPLPLCSELRPARRSPCVGSRTAEGVGNESDHGTKDTGGGSGEQVAALPGTRGKGSCLMPFDSAVAGLFLMPDAHFCS